jgi:hypothetical protein
MEHRVYELSKELDITSKELIGILINNFNIEAKNHMSALSENEYLLVKNTFFTKMINNFTHSNDYKTLLENYKNKEYIKDCNYAVITSDIINSKKIDNLNNIINYKLHKVNKLFIKELLTPFTTSRGDEIQAVCHNIYYLPKIIRYLRYVCLPIKLRIGVGIGSIEYTPNTINSWEMNGQAFFKARTAIETIKDKTIPCTFTNTTFRNIDLNNKYDITELSINTIFNLMDTIMNKWTLKQWEAIQYYGEQNTYEKVAQLVDVSWQSIQKRLKSADWSVFEDSESNLSYILKKKYSNILQ